MLVWGLPKYEIENERSNRKIQHLWSYGFVDCLQTDGSPKLAGYMAKYMSKAMSDTRLLGKQAFKCSRNVLRPVLFKTAEIVDFVLDGLPVDNSHTITREFDTKWLGRCLYKKLVIK